MHGTEHPASLNARLPDHLRARNWSMRHTEHRRGGAEHVKQILDHPGIEKAHILAFSFGGLIGFQFLLSYPERAHSAILLEPYLPREAQAGVEANTKAFMDALAIYQTGDKLGAALN